MMGYGLGMGGFGLLWMLLFWGVLIFLAVWLVSLLFPAAKNQTPPPSDSPSALEILQTRYARGELTTDQYQEMRQTIIQT
jgi:putative membrane protein